MSFHSLSEPRMIMDSSASYQRGVVILESLIAIFIFSLGVIGLIAMYSNSVVRTSDAQYRMEATHYANQLLNEIWINVDRSTGSVTATSLTPFALNSTTTAFNPTMAGQCQFTGGT